MDRSLEQMNRSVQTEDEDNDESKIFYNQIGVVQFSIDDVFKHILMTRENNY